MVDLAHDGRRQAVAADHGDRVEVVGKRALVLALRGAEFDRGHASIIVAARGVRMKAKSKGKKLNKAWLNDHLNDPYVKLAQKEGYRARAAYKLKEIDETLGLVRPGQLVVDLGAAPGAWSQYLRRRFAPKGAAAGAQNGVIIALDLLDFEPIEGVDFIQGDFHDEAVVRQLEDRLGGRAVDLIVSDMAPNLSGIASSDAARMAHLVELAVEFAEQHLVAQGALVCKVFHGSGYSQIVERLKRTFTLVKPIKPKASRDKSAETFLVGRGLKRTVHPVDTPR
jgi:23S rRNA (uridine2552-2'-O)-methyltransferase